MTASRVEEGRVTDGPGTSCWASRSSVTDGDMSKGHRDQLEEFPTGQIWDNSSIKNEHNDYVTNVIDSITSNEKKIKPCATQQMRHRRKSLWRFSDNKYRRHDQVRKSLFFSPQCNN